MYLLEIELPAPETVLLSERDHRCDHICARGGVVHELVKQLEVPARIDYQRHDRNFVLSCNRKNGCGHLASQVSFRIDAIALRADDGYAARILFEARYCIGRA